MSGQSGGRHLRRTVPAGVPSALAQGHGPRVVALGGGHGLAVSLRALRRVTDALTAIVGVSDDGGSSGRLRKEFGILPPGDLRMALAALCGDDMWGRTWSDIVQHRFGGLGELHGHSVGNLLITALWEQTGDVVAGLDWVAALLGAHGRVLPLSTVPLDIVADVEGVDPFWPEVLTRVRGQVSVATTKGRVRDIWLEPADPPACPEALAAIAGADVVVLGPGSWFTSVLPHLMVPDIAAAIMGSGATRVLVLNLVPQEGETGGFAPETHLEVLVDRFPDLRLDVVLADPRMVTDPGSRARLSQACSGIGAELVLERVSGSRSQTITSAAHDPDLLAAAFAGLIGTRQAGGG